MAKVQVPDRISEAEMLRLMQEHGPMLVGMCTLLLRDAHLAQNVAQEAFIRAWLRGSFEWLSTCAEINTAPVGSAMWTAA